MSNHRCNTFGYRNIIGYVAYQPKKKKHKTKQKQKQKQNI